MTMYRVLLACGLASVTACSVPDYFLVDGQGGGSGDGGGKMDAGADAMPDAEPGAAVVMNVSSSSTDGFFKAGASISIQVTFDQAVTVDTASGTPQLALNTGAHVNYTSGSGTATLTFTYPVVAGESAGDLDYASTTALTLNGGTIKNGTINASLALPAPGATHSLGANKALVIDAVAPSVSTITGPNLYMASSSATLTYSVTETNAGTTTCTQTVGTGVVANCTITGAMFSGLSEGNHTISITHTDLAGNVSPAKTISWTVDTIVPTVSSISGPAQYAQSASASLTFSVTETNPGTTNCTQTVGTGTVSSCTTNGASFSALSEGAHTITVTHTDLAGQTSTARTYSWNVDTINPSISTPTGPAAFDPNKSATVAYTVTEANQGSTTCNFTQGTGTITSCTATGATLASLNEGPHTLSITHTDLANRTGSQTIMWTVDTISPVISVISGPPNDWTGTDPVTLAYTITEANPMTTSCNQDSGTAVETTCTTTRVGYMTMSIGQHDITIKHTDKAGHVASQTYKFSYCPAITFQSVSTGGVPYTLPNGCGSTMDVWMWGGGGAGSSAGGPGGGGGFVHGTLNTGTFGAGFTVYVGGGAHGAVGGVGGGGNGGNNGLQKHGGGGGGASALSQGGVIMAAGGGGGGGECVSAGGGAGGGLSGQDGSLQLGGFGSTQTGGGTGVGNGEDGTANQGGSGGVGPLPNGCAGGGGGGAYVGVGGGGGGGGGQTGTTSGGGGGAADFAPTSIWSNLVHITGAGPSPGGTSDPHYISGYAVGGGAGSASQGTDGIVIIQVHP